MTTIGTAVLQIIPSLKGVTEAIEKQIAGKTVEVPIAPKVDKTAAKKAGQDAGEAIATEAKEAVRKGDIGKAVAEDVKTSVKKSGAGREIAKVVADDVKSASPGKDIGKVIVDEMTDSVKQRLPSGGVGRVIFDGISDGIKQGMSGGGGDSGLGGQIVGGLVDGIKQGLKNTDLTDALGGLLDVNITGPVQAITNSLNPLKDAMAGFKQGDVSGGLAAATQALRGLEGLGVPTEAGDALKRIGDVADQSKGQVSQLLTPLQQMTELAGPDSKIFKAGSKLPIVGSVIEALPVFNQINTEAEHLVTNLTGMNIPLSPQSLIAKLLDDGPNGLGVLTTATDRAHQALQAAQEQEQALRLNRGDRDPRLPANVTGGRAHGGAISGPGGPTSDIIPIWASNGEFVVNAADAQKNLALLNIINSGKMPGFAGGGEVGPDVQAAQSLVGTAYSQSKRFDCSGSVARVIDRALGLPESGLMTTKTASQWLSARGFKPGTGGPGTISVGWYDHGPGPNDGHMAMTLSNGLNAESGGSHGSFLIGGAAAGASSPQFDQHMYLPIAVQPNAIRGEGDRDKTQGDAAPSVFGEGGGGGGSGVSLPSSISGLAGFGLDSLGAGVGKTKSGSDLSVFGKAAGAAVSGQVASALGVFGVNDTPGFLKAASQLVGGISIGGHSLFDTKNLFGGQGAAGASAVPVSAGSAGTGTLPPDDGGGMHGDRAGQAPGPTYIINARDTEDAFIRSQRQERERAAAKLDRF